MEFVNSMKTFIKEHHDFFSLLDRSVQRSHHRSGEEVKSWKPDPGSRGGSLQDRQD